MAFLIPLYQPHLKGNEAKYVSDCVTSSWVSSRGSYVDAFEKAFGNYIGGPITACSNGTVALHLALLAAGVGPGDEVIVPSFTYVATVAAVRYVGATPVYADCETSDWNISLTDVQSKISEKTKAIIVVHVYGYSADIANICDLCKKHHITVMR